MLLCFLLCFSLLGALQIINWPVLIENLNSLISEYEDCEVTLLVLSPHMAFEPLTFPVVISNVAPKSNFVRELSRSGRFHLALFILFPETRFSEWEDCRNYVKYYIPGIPLDSNVYVNVITSDTWQFKTGNTGLLSSQEKEVLAVYQMKKTSRFTASRVYAINSVWFGVHIPDRSSPLYRKLHAAYKVVFVLLAPSYEQIQIGAPAFRKEISKRLNGIVYGGSFYADVGPMLDNTVFERLTVAGQVNSSQFVRVKDLIRAHYGNPFKKTDDISFYELNYGVAYPSELITLERIGILALEAFDGWIERDYSLMVPLPTVMILGWSIKGIGRYLTSEAYDSMTSITTILNDPRSGTRTFLVPAVMESFNFMTCDGVSQGLSYRIYFAPYDVSTWVSIVFTSILLIPISILLLFKLQSPCSFQWLTHMCLWLDLIVLNAALAVEVAVDIPKILKKIPRAYRNAQFILGVWALLTLVLVNAYKGIVTSETTAYPTVTQKYTTVKQMDGFTFYATKTLTHQLKVHLEKNNTYVQKSNIVDVTNLKECLCHPDVPELIPIICSYEPAKQPAQFGHVSPELLKGLDSGAFHTCSRVREVLLSIGISVPINPDPSFCEYNSKNSIYNSLVSNYRESKVIPKLQKSFEFYCDAVFAINVMQPGRESLLSLKNSIVVETAEYMEDPSTPAARLDIIKRIRNCRKTAYIDTDLNLDNLIFASENTYKDKEKFRKGKDKLLHRVKGILISSYYAGIERTYRRVLDLMAHGIYQIWHRWSVSNNKGVKKQAQLTHKLKILKSRENPVTLDSNILLIFNACLVCSLMSATVFIAELCINYMLSFYYLFVVLLSWRS